MAVSEKAAWFLSIIKNPFHLNLESFDTKIDDFRPQGSQFGPLTRDSPSYLVFYGLLNPNKYHQETQPYASSNLSALSHFFFRATAKYPKRCTPSFSPVHVPDWNSSGKSGQLRSRALCWRDSLSRFQPGQR